MGYGRWPARTAAAKGVHSGIASWSQGTAEFSLLTGRNFSTQSQLVTRGTHPERDHHRERFRRFHQHKRQQIWCVPFEVAGCPVPEVTICPTWTSQAAFRIISHGRTGNYRRRRRLGLVQPKPIHIPGTGSVMLGPLKDSLPLRVRSVDHRTGQAGSKKANRVRSRQGEVY